MFNGLSLFYSGILAVIVSWIFTSCRLGNRIEATQTEPPSPLAYYEISPQKLQYCAHVGQTVCKFAPPDQVPLMVSTIFSNPVALYIPDPESKEASFISLEGKHAKLPIDVNPDQSLSFVAQTLEEPFLESRTCKTRLSFEESGRIEKTSGSAPNINGYPISGRIHLRFTLIEKFIGDCQSELSMAALCLVQKEYCPGDSSESRQSYQNYFLDYFGDYLDSKVIAPSDVSKLTGLAFEITYE